MAVFRYLIISLVLFPPALLFPAPVSAQEVTHSQRLEVTPLAIESEGGFLEFEVEVARTPREQQIGLMFRQEMAPSHGMIFHYEFPQRVAFWMKNTTLPLDIIFIQPDGTIVNIVQNTTPLSLDPIASQGWITGVLELNGGTVAARGIKPGDTVHHGIFNNQLETGDD